MVRATKITLMVLGVVMVTAFAAVLRHDESTEGFTETVGTKENAYMSMLRREMGGTAAGKNVVMAALRKIGDREAARVRNPNAKRLHNAAMERLIANVEKIFAKSTTVRL